ncbi:MAG: FAD-dependent oxidoreductase [Clostridia bacterium]
MSSIWENVKVEGGKPLKQNIERDIVVIGGGIAGILTAFQLSEKGEKVTLVEAKPNLCEGVTKNTTAHITAHQGPIYSNLKAKHSLDYAKKYFQSQLDAIDEYEKLINNYNIDCDFKRVDAYLFSRGETKDLQNEFKTLLSIDAKPEYVIPKINLEMTKAILIKNQAIFHPLKFLNSLPKKFEIYTSTCIIDVDLNKKLLFTEKFVIKANKIIFATNYPIVNVRGSYFIKLYKSSSYAISTNEIVDIGGIFNEDIGEGITLRNYGRQIIIGGLDHRTGRMKTCEAFETLEKTASQCYKNAEIENRWDANDTMTSDEVPLIGQFDLKHKDIYIITGFNKWGMANAMIGSLLIVDLVQSLQSKYADIFCPQRHKFKLGFFFANMGVVIKDLLFKPLSIPFNSYKNLKPDTGDIVSYHGRKRAVYKDKNGKLFVCKPYCKHLGCQLQFNSNTKTWDCPCHGSRYDLNGKIICSPTVKNLESKNNS